MMGDKGTRYHVVNNQWDRGVRDITCLTINENYAIKLFKMNTESDNSFFNFY